MRLRAESVFVVLLDGELLLRLSGPVARTAGLATRRTGLLAVRDHARSRNYSAHPSPRPGRAAAPRWRQSRDSFHETEGRAVGHGAEPFLSGLLRM